jgi:hypothetical protein
MSLAPENQAAHGALLARGRSFEPHGSYGRIVTHASLFRVIGAPSFQVIV